MANASGKERGGESVKLQKRFRDHVLMTEHVVPAGSTVVVGCSGRSDSVALLHLLHDLAPELRLRLVVAHLQPDDSTRARADAAFVLTLAETLDLEFDHFVTDGADDSRPPTPDSRRTYLEHVAKRTKAGAIATGETADDLAEELLDALVSDRPFSVLFSPHSIPWLRPLSAVTHADCLTFLAERNLAWKQDPDSLALSDTRRKLRLLVLPLLTRHVQDTARTNLGQAAQRLAADEQFLADLTVAARAEAGWAESADGVGLDFGRWAALPPSLRLRLLADAARAAAPSAPRVTPHASLVAFDARCRLLTDGAAAVDGPLKVERARGILRLSSAG